MLRFNSIKQKLNMKMTDEGFLHIQGNLLEAEKEMTYYNRHGPIKEKISKDALFSNDVKNSFLFKTVTLEHPEKDGKMFMINSLNTNEFKKGTIIDVFENGNCLSATLQIEDKETINFVLDEMKENKDIELSAGYSAETKFNNGIYFQEDLKGNHVALLHGKGRAGKNVRLIYNYMEDIMDKFKFNNEEITGEVLLQKANELQTQLTEITEKYNSKVETERKENLKNITEKFNIAEGKDEFETMLNVIKLNNPKFNSEEFKNIEDIQGVFNYAVESLESDEKFNTGPNKKITGNANTDDNKFNSTYDRNAFHRGYKGKDVK